MPDMTLTSVGFSVLFVNIGAQTITIYKHDGASVLTTLASGQAVYTYLTDNTTSNGLFTSIDFGGGVSAAGDFLLERIQTYFETFTFPQVRESTKIKLALLGNEAGVIGAASLARELSK